MFERCGRRFSLKTSKGNLCGTGIILCFTAERLHYIFSIALRKQKKKKTIKNK
jgi:hypothetical protein